MSEEDSTNTILSDRRMALFGESKDGDWRTAPKLVFSVYRGSIGITIFTNDQNDTGQGPIRASLGPALWQMFVDAVYQMSDPSTQNGELRKFQVQSQQGQQISTQCEVVVGKDEQGIVYSAVIQEGRPKKKIPIAPPNLIEFYDANNQPLDASAKSSIFARAFITQIDKHVTAIARNTWQPMPQQNNGSGNGQQSTQVPGAPSQGSTQEQAPIGDDLPL